MEFIDNTGHIFSLKSYNEKPIGYEYNENSYIFWIDSNTSKLSINNYYSRPIYALYYLDNDYNIDELKNDENSPIKISIEIENSDIYKLIASNELNDYIISNKYNNLNDYIDLGEVNSDSSYLKSSLSNKDLFVIKTTETIENNKNLMGVNLDYLLIPIYPIACAKEEGTWITNIMIHIYDENTNNHTWCPISIGGEFINEYEELIINEQNTGVNLPKDILKAIYRESLYNDEFNEALFNEKLKEYLINKTIIKHECGNFNSAIASLKWFEYGDKLTISKLLKTDNDLLNQYLLDYFNIKNDIIESFKLFTSGALISLKLMINKETDELYPFNINDEYKFFGENKPKMLSLLDYYEKVKIGNHNMPIENDDEKYWYWKPYFDFSFLELGIKLACLKKFYKQYFLPLHLYVHNVSLGYKVYANDIKYTVTSGVSMSEPCISLNSKDREVEFNDIQNYYFSKQIHYIDNNFNEFCLNDIENDKREWFEIDDTCVNIPIKFVNNESNHGYFNCVLLLINENISNKALLETHFSFVQTDEFIYKNLIIYPKKINLKRGNSYWWIGPEDNPINTHVKVTDEDKVFIPCLINSKWYVNDTYICDAYDNYVPYIKYNIDELSIETNYLQYWINDDYTLRLLVNNKWYEYKFNLKIHNPTIDFGTLRYRYYLNEHNYLLSRINDNESKIHSFIFTNELDNLKSIKQIDPNYILSDITNINEYTYNLFNLHGDRSFVKTIDISNIDNLWQYFESNYNILSPFTQLNRIDDVNHKISFNSYMHNTELINVNNINFDIDFYTILKYHLDHNLMYIDGTLLNRYFYQYIIYNYEGKNVEILIHKDMIGMPLEIPFHYFNKDKIIACAWNENLYILEECGKNSNSYHINTLYNDNNIFISEGDKENSYSLLLDALSLKYDKVNKEYYSFAIDPITKNEIIGDRYPLYDKLYCNTDYIYDKYHSEINLPNLDKYKNSIHLFNIYTKETLNTNILIFHNDIDIYINGLRFTHNKYAYKEDEIYESLKIFISGSPNYEHTNTRTLDVYGLHLITPYIENGRIMNIPEEIRIKNYEYYLYVKRDYEKYFEPNYDEEHIENIYELDNIFDYDVNEFSYYLENNQNTKYTFIGNLYFKTIDDFYSNNFYDKILVSDYENIEIFKEENTYYFYDLEVKDLTNFTKYYKNKIFYKIYFYNDNDERIDITLNAINNISYSYVKIDLYYIKCHIVRNRLYLLIDYLNEYINKGYNFEFIDDTHIKVLDSSNNPIIYNDNEVIITLIKLPPKYMYIDNIDGHLLSNQNPAYYWFNIDNNSIKTLPSYLNELERFIYDNNNESLSSILEQLDIYKEKFEYNRNNPNDYLDDLNEVRYRYINYLSKDFTGKKGKFKLTLESNFISNFTVRLVLEVFDKDNNRIIYTNKDNEFILNGDEQSVILYIQLNELDINSNINNWIIPRLYEIQTIDKQLEYNYEECGDNKMITNFLNKEYIYGDNNSEFVYNLYKDFFELKFNIYDSYIKDELNYCELLNSIYDIKDVLKLNMHLDYDFYLMHDDKYWYGLYISKQTCNCVKKINDLSIPENKKYIEFIGNNSTHYALKYAASSKEYLINRLEYISSNGYNQFKDDDIIACHVWNNNRLPINPYISSKWSIYPMSLGMSLESKFESNGELTILSMPKNDNKYQRGYYKVTVKYSLDRDIQHQFKNTSTLCVS